MNEVLCEQSKEGRYWGRRSGSSSRSSSSSSSRSSRSRRKGERI